MVENKTTKVDGEVNKKLFGLKISSEEDEKVTEKAENEKPTEIWNTKFEDVKGNSEDETINCNDGNLYIDMSGTDVCENISFGNKEDEEKIWNFICNGMFKDLEANKKSKELNSVGQKVEKNAKKSDSSFMITKTEKDEVKKTEKVQAVHEVVILKDFKDVRKNEDEILLKVSTNLRKCDEKDTCVEKNKNSVVLADAEKYGGESMKAVKNIEVSEDVNDISYKQTECTRQVL